MATLWMSGHYTIEISADGRIWNAIGERIADITCGGQICDANGNVVGEIADGKIWDLSGNLVAYHTSGRIYDPDGKHLTGPG